MQLEQHFTLASAPDAVWAAFHDLPLLVDCLPGAAIKPGAAPPVAGEEMPLLFKVKLGPIAAGFAGQGRVLFDEATQTGSFSGSAVDSKTNSRVKGEAKFGLQPDTVGTRVDLVVDFTITGALAQFSREGIVRALAEQLTRQFADNLQARLPQVPVASTTTSSAAEPAPVVTPPASRPPPADTSSIDLWRLLKTWLRGLLPGRR